MFDEVHITQRSVTKQTLIVENKQGNENNNKKKILKQRSTGIQRKELENTIHKN